MGRENVSALVEEAASSVSGVKLAMKGENELKAEIAPEVECGAPAGLDLFLLFVSWTVLAAEGSLDEGESTRDSNTEGNVRCSSGVELGACNPT